MTKPQFVAGVPFAVFGLNYDLRFNSSTDNLECTVEDKVIHSSFIIHPDTEEPHFTAFIPVFGQVQPVMISYSHCELK